MLAIVAKLKLNTKFSCCKICSSSDTSDQLMLRNNLDLLLQEGYSNIIIIFFDSALLSKCGLQRLACNASWYLQAMLVQLCKQENSAIYLNMAHTEEFMLQLTTLTINMKSVLDFPFKCAHRLPPKINFIHSAHLSSEAGDGFWDLCWFLVSTSFESSKFSVFQGQQCVLAGTRSEQLKQDVSYVLQSTNHTLIKTETLLSQIIFNFIFIHN